MIESFFITGPEASATPVLLSVPHAGRYYPGEMQALARVSSEQLMVLEDRHADALTVRASDAEYSVISARVARAWIDLNRGVTELDPEMIWDVSALAVRHRMTAKVRGGLGLIPSRIARVGDIWRARLDPFDIENRIEDYHRPYHDQLSEQLQARRAKFGCAVLLDVHSMPPLKADREGPPPHIVIGNLHGRAADVRFSDAVIDEIRSAGFRVRLNTPYAGGYILEEHSNPKQGIHGLQIEIDRSLYLCPDLKEPGPGLPVMQNLILRLADVVSTEASAAPFAIAAE
jgi:N-formylglutamate amidohydrolase